MKALDEKSRCHNSKRQQHDTTIHGIPFHQLLRHISQKTKFEPPGGATVKIGGSLMLVGLIIWRQYMFKNFMATD